MLILLLAVAVSLGLGIRYLLPRWKAAARTWAWVRERCWAWGLLLVAVLGAGLGVPFAWLVLVALALIAFRPKTATALLPWALLGYGLAGFYLERYALPGRPYGFLTLPSPFALPQAGCFLAAGGWLFPRLDAPGTAELRALTGRPRDIESPAPWALVLLPVLALAAELCGMHTWLGMPLWDPFVTVMADLCTGVAALVLILRRPRLAAAGALAGHHPDVAIVDVRLPPANTGDGLREDREARQKIPGLSVLVLSRYVERLYARELLADQAGGVGYLLKDRVFNDEAFAGAIRAVAAG